MSLSAPPLPGHPWFLIIPFQLILPTWSVVNLQLRENGPFHWWLWKDEVFQFLAEWKSLRTTELEWRNGRTAGEEEILQNKQELFF